MESHKPFCGSAISCEAIQFLCKVTIHPESVARTPDKCPRAQSGHLESRICPLPGRGRESVVRVVPVLQHRDIQLVSVSRSSRQS